MQDSVTGGCLGLGGDGEKLHLVSGSRQLKLGELYLRSPASDCTVGGSRLSIALLGPLDVCLGLKPKLQVAA
jgi:hypothetical protein